MSSCKGEGVKLTELDISASGSGDVELISLLKKSGDKKSGLVSLKSQLREVVKDRTVGSGKIKSVPIAARLQLEETPVVIEKSEVYEESNQKLDYKPEQNCAFSASSSSRVSSSSSTISSSESTNTISNTRQSSGQKRSQKPRRRVATLAQRRAANIRERRRMFNLNAAFDRLRKKVPSFAYEKRLSRIETLKLAIMYIKFMDDLVNDSTYADKYKQLTGTPSSGVSSMSSSFLTSGSYLSSLYNHCESPSSAKRQLQTMMVAPSLAEAPKRASQRQSQSKIEEFCQSQNLGPCNETSCLSQQYRARALPGSPISSMSVACCSSPTSSSVTTCHSGSSIFNESPNSSPQIIQPPSQPVCSSREHSLVSHQYQHHLIHHPSHYYDQQQQQQQPTADYYSSCNPQKAVYYGAPPHDMEPVGAHSKLGEGANQSQEQPLMQSAQEVEFEANLSRQQQLSEQVSSYPLYLLEAR